MNPYGIIASFLGTFVEFVEALTIILAVGTTRGWRSALSGAGLAMALLIGLVAAIGTPLVGMLQVDWVQLLVGLMMLLFGTRWLREAILRYAGLKSLKDQAEAFEEESDRQRKAGNVGTGIDSAAFLTTLSTTFLEGLEASFIVLTFGLRSRTMGSAILGASLGLLLVLALGMIFRKPLTKVPENTMKFVVGVMLTTYGTFWLGESLQVAWPHEEFSILYLAGTLCLFSWLLISRCKRKLLDVVHTKGRGGPMKALQAVWGLLFDDARLAITLIVSLLLSGVAHYFEQPALAIGFVLIGLAASLWVSIEHELQLKLRKK